MFFISYHVSIFCQSLVFRFSFTWPFLCHLFLSFLCLGRVWKTPIGLSLVLQGRAGNQASVKSDRGDDQDYVGVDDDADDNGDNDLDDHENDDDDCDDELTHLYTS